MIWNGHNIWEEERSMMMKSRSNDDEVSNLEP